MVCKASLAICGIILFIHGYRCCVILVNFPLLFQTLNGASPRCSIVKIALTNKSQPMLHPKISVIIPTTHNRKPFNERILNMYIQQDYINKELLWDYEEGTIGEKRNRLCARATGEVIIHMDSDDSYRPDWITKSVEALISSDADIVGLERFHMIRESDQAIWKFYYPGPTYLSGATMVYHKKYWEAEPFQNIMSPEDIYFLLVRKVKPKIFPHDYIDGFMATIHEGNTCRKTLDNPVYTRLSVEDEESVLSKWGLLKGLGPSGK